MKYAFRISHVHTTLWHRKFVKAGNGYESKFEISSTQSFSGSFSLDSTKLLNPQHIFTTLMWNEFLENEAFHKDIAVLIE